VNVLIVDDEPLARARLRRLLDALPAHACIGEAADGDAALDACRQLNPDVVLLDIRMPGRDGVSAARALTALPVPPAIVFTTAFNDYAADAFDVAAVHYLLKPVSAERLAQALDRVAVAAPPTLLVSRRSQVQRVALADVLYVQAEAKYLTVHTGIGEWLLEDSLARLEARLAPHLLRIHRAVLVNVHHLRGLQRDAEGRVWATVDGVTLPLPVSRRLAVAVQQALGQPGGDGSVTPLS
jgi:two-component system response regulator AlgR